MRDGDEAIPAPDAGLTLAEMFKSPRVVATCKACGCVRLRRELDRFHPSDWKCRDTVRCDSDARVMNAEHFDASEIHEVPRSDLLQRFTQFPRYSDDGEKVRDDE